jgi:outer membrane protein assembly factor BamB
MPATLDGQKAVLFHLQKALYAFGFEDGRQLWRSEFGSGYETHSSDPVLTTAGVFISSGDDGGELLKVDGKGGKRVWKNKNLSTFTGTAVEDHGYLYGVDAGGYKNGQQAFRCLDLTTGEIRWSLPGFGQDSWILAGDRMIVLRDNGELMVLKVSPAKGEIVARVQALGGKCWTQPTLSDGRLYCRNAAGVVNCFDLR